MPASAAWNTSARAIALAHYAARGEMPPASAQHHSFGYVEPFQIAQRIAASLDPSARIDYIPVKDRSMCYWVGDTFHDPCRGDFLWVGDAPKPATAYDIKRTRLFTCRQCISSNVRDVVLKSKERWVGRKGVQWDSKGKWWIDSVEVTRWMVEAREEWRRDVGELWYRCIDKKKWCEAYDMLLGGILERKDFLDWCDQQAWWCDQEADWGITPLSSEVDMEVSEEEGEVPHYDLDMGWERLEAFLERGGLKKED